MKHLVDLDEGVLERARQHLGTGSPQDTVNAALRLAAARGSEGRNVDVALDNLAAVEFESRSDAWR